MAIRNWIATKTNDQRIAREYGFVKDYLPDLVIKGYKLTVKPVKGKKLLFAQLFRDGKLIEELPIIDREIDIYITGRYKIRSGRQKGQEVEIKIRLPLKVTYIPKKEFLDDFRNDIESKAYEQFDKWTEEEMPDLHRQFDKVDIEFAEKMEEK